MEKSFNDWNTKKKRIELVHQRANFSEREIWFVHLGVNIGSEQDGAGKDFIRPVVILRKFNNDVFWGIPLTRTKKESPYYFNFLFKNQSSSAILTQVRLIDALRLSYKIGHMKKVEFYTIKEKFRALVL